MSKHVPGLIKRPKAGGGFEWHIDKRIKDYGRLCESTGTDDAEEAARYLAKRIDEIRNAKTLGPASEIVQAGGDEQTSLTWLERAPFIQMLDDRDASVAYPAHLGGTGSVVQRAERTSERYRRFRSEHRFFGTRSYAD